MRAQEFMQGVAEGSQQINWVKPNFDFEWHEVEEQSRMKQVPADVRRYYQKHFPNKDAWLKAVQNGKAVVVPPNHSYEIRNAPFDKESLQKVLAPTGHEGPIGPAKEKRVNALFDKGQVEMPIILKTSQGLWLIGGKTRLGTANYIKGIPAKVWMIGGEQGVSEGSLAEFAPDSSGDDGDDGFSEETLKRLAAQWWQGDEDPRVERTLAAAGWEIGQDEGYDDEPGVFVVQAGDVNGNSYISWPAHELKGVSEGWRENLAAVGIAGTLATATPAQAQAQPTVSADPIVATVVIDGEQRRLDLSAKNFGDVREAERWLAKFMRDRGIRDWQGKIERGQPGSGRYQRITIQGAGGLDEQRRRS